MYRCLHVDVGLEREDPVLHGTEAVDVDAVRAGHPGRRVGLTWASNRTPDVERKAEGGKRKGERGGRAEAVTDPGENAGSRLHLLLINVGLEDGGGGIGSLERALVAELRKRGRCAVTQR